MCLPQNAKGSTVQRLATRVANILCLNFGLMFGITPGHSSLYESVDTPLNRPIDTETSSWLSGYLFLSAAIGAIVFGLLSQKIGPKAVLLFGGLLQISGWFCIHFAYDITHIYSSRIFAGVAGGAAFAVLPVFISEITETSQFNSLLSSIDQWRTLGILIGFILGKYLRYDYVAIVGICVSFIFSMSFPFVQETPYFYMRKGNVASFEKSLRWYRGIRQIEDRENPEFMREVNELKNEMEGNMKIPEYHFSRCYCLKLAMCGIVLTVGAQLSGLYVILNDGGTVLGQTYISADLSGVNCILILAASQVIGTTASTWMVKKISKKILLSIAALICGLTLICFVLMRIYCTPDIINVQQTFHVYLGMLVFYTIIANIGLYPMVMIILHELTPSKFRFKIIAMATALTFFVVFLLVKFFYTINVIMATIGWFWLFGISSILIGLYTIFLLPEKREKTSESVRVLGYSSNGTIAKVHIISNSRSNNNI